MIYYVFAQFAVHNDIDLIRFGAKANFLIADFKLWNLITPSFLHTEFFHLLSNLLGLMIVGKLVEAFIGTKNTVLLIFFSAIISNLGSYLLNDNDVISLGASGIVFALFGVHIFLYLEHRDVFVSQMLPFAKQITILIVINLVYTFIQPGIDIGSHLFGLLSGMCFCYLLSDKRHKLYAISFLAIILALFIYKTIDYRNSEEFIFMKNLYREYLRYIK